MRPLTSLLLPAVPLVAQLQVSKARDLPLNHPHHSFNQARRAQQELQDTTSLRAFLLADYDKGTFPFVQFWNDQNTTLKSGLPIQVGLNFHRVFKVDVMSSVADLIVWVRQSWVDPRLTWNPDDYNGIDTLQLWVGDGSGSAGDSSEIWTPDLLLWNLESPLAETLGEL